MRNREGFQDPREITKSLRETQFRQDKKTLEGLLDGVEPKELTELSTQIEEQLQGLEETGRDEKNEKTFYALSDLRRMSDVLGGLQSSKDWDGQLERNAKKDVFEFDKASKEAERRMNTGELELSDDIHSAVVVLARAIDRMADARFPEELKVQSDKAAEEDADWLEEAKEKSRNTNVT